MASSFSLIRLVLALCTAVVTTLPLSALDTSQSALLRDVESLLKTAETSLALAQQAAGAGGETLAGSKAKLVLVRLQGAIDALPQIKARLERLPATEATVATATERYSNIQRLVDGLKARLSGGPASSGSSNGSASPAINSGSTAKSSSTSPANAAAAASATQRLDYRQREELKNAQFHVDAVVGNAAALAELAEKVKATPDVQQLDARELQAGLNTLASARKSAGLATPRIAALPAQGEGVTAITQELQSALRSLEASEAVIAPAQARLAAVAGPGNLPKLEQDTQRLRDLGGMYSDRTLFDRNLTQAADRVRELPAAKAEQRRIMETYAALLRQSTPEGAALTTANAFFLEHTGAFAAELDRRKAGWPQVIDAQFNKIDTLTKDAVANQKPAYFTQGIPDELRRLEQLIAFQTALDASSAETGKTRLIALRAHLTQQQNALREAIVAANELPKDEFSGGDRADIIRLATAAWRKIDPRATVLTVRIPNPSWSRDVRWRNQTGDWYKIDRSYLQAEVIVRFSDSLAAIRPVDLWKNHLERDAITATPQDDLTTELQPHDFILLKKVK